MYPDVLSACSHSSFEAGNEVSLTRMRFPNFFLLKCAAASEENRQQKREVLNNMFNSHSEEEAILRYERFEATEKNGRWLALSQDRGQIVDS